MKLSMIKRMNNNYRIGAGRQQQQQPTIIRSCMSLLLLLFMSTSVAVVLIFLIIQHHHHDSSSSSNMIHSVVYAHSSTSSLSSSSVLRRHKEWMMEKESVQVLSSSSLSSVRTLQDLPVVIPVDSNETAAEAIHTEIDDFVPLQCNRNISSSSSITMTNTTTTTSTSTAPLSMSSECTMTWTNQFGMNTNYPTRLTIPCGQCIVMNYNNVVLTFQDGMNIIGKLIIPDGMNITIQTTSIIVQGELIIDSSRQSINGISPIQILMFGTNETIFIPQDENRYNCGNTETCMIGTQAIVVAGGKIQLVGIPPTTPTWVPLYDAYFKESMIPSSSSSSTTTTTTTTTSNTVQHISAITHVNVLVVPSTIVGTWDIGAEILITSHTIQWDIHSVRTILYMEPSPIDDGTMYHLLYLNETIVRPTTMKSSNNQFGVEVALLSRNILFKSIEPIVASNNDTRGGHFMIYHTPTIQQHIEGIDIQYFGQQGNLGRYPLHFHFCKSVQGSIVLKNTVRHSSQRCYVIHGTSDLLVQQNIAYDTRGHCYITEDGIETNNQFIENLGAQTRNQLHKLLHDDTDDLAATYWITNPTNSFIGNVAAGSESTGFWIEPLKRGMRETLYPSINPDTDRLLAFTNNIAHSNAKYGVRTYPHGYHPLNYGDAIFDQMKLYRNEGGIFIHDSRHIIISNTVFADNKHVNVDIDKFSDGTKLINITVIGYSDSYRTVLESQYNNNNINDDSTTTSSNTIIQQMICYNADLLLYGMELHSYQELPSAPHTYIENVTLVDFTNTPCNVSLPIMLSDIGNFDLKPFDTFPTLINSQITDRNVINLCKESIKNVYINLLNTTLVSDSDSRFATTVITDNTNANNNTIHYQPKTILSQQDEMLQFVNQTNCINDMNNCYTICYNTCYTTAIFRIDPFATQNYTMKVCSKYDIHDCIFLKGALRFNEGKYVSYRDYLIHLPTGSSYTAVTLDGNHSETWPNFVYEEYDESVCPTTTTTTYQRSTIDMIVPPLFVNNESSSTTTNDVCNELIKNNDMEQVDDINIFVPKYWAQRDNMMITSAALVGNNNSTATKVVISNEDLDDTKILFQYIDTRCLQYRIGHWYTITANIKLVRNTEDQYICDSLTNDYCPQIGLGTYSGYNVTVATVTTQLNEYGYQIASGSIQIDTKLVNELSVHVFIISQVSWGMYVDNVTMSYNGQWSGNATINNETTASRR